MTQMPDTWRKLPVYELTRSGHIAVNGRLIFAADSTCAAPIQPRPFQSGHEAELWLISVGVDAVVNDFRVNP